MFYIYLTLSKKNSIFASTSSKYFKSGSQSRLNNIVFPIKEYFRSYITNQFGEY